MWAVPTFVITPTVGSAIAASRRDLAAVVHAELDHEVAMRRVAAEERQRQAELVVQVALGGEARPERPRGSRRTSPWSWSCRCCP